MKSDPAGKFLSLVRGAETAAAERSNGSGAFARVLSPRNGGGVRLIISKIPADVKSESSYSPHWMIRAFV